MIALEEMLAITSMGENRREPEYEKALEIIQENLSPSKDGKLQFATLPRILARALLQGNHSL